MWGNSICHQIHVSVVLLYLTLMSLTSEAGLLQSSVTVPVAEGLLVMVPHLIGDTK